MITRTPLPDERYPAMKTVEDWNWWFNEWSGTQPHSIVGLTTQTGKTYCANCVSHVHVFELGEGVSPIYKDDRMCGTCHGCYVSICNCKIEAE